MITVNIRRNVFETNSSSSHSISISNNIEGILETINCDSEGNIILDPKDFGREYKAYNDAETKLTYCMLDTDEGSPEREFLKKIVKEHVGANDITIQPYNEETPSIYGAYGVGYICGGSKGTSRVAFSSEESLKNFIFNPDSWLFTASDEIAPPPNFYDVNKNITYKYVLVVDGTNTVYKFKEFPNENDVKLALESIFEYHPLCNKDCAQDEYYFYPEKMYNNDFSFSSIDKLNEGYVELFKISYRRRNFGAEPRDKKQVKIYIVKLEN